MPESTIVLNNRYELLERIGSGGMARVFKAQDNALGRIVAVKMLHESLTSDPSFLEKFQREAYAAANLSHPNIVTIHDIGQDGYRHYIVMEYVAGQTLKQIIKLANEMETFLPVSRVLDLTIQICHGVGYAHRANLVHCDVKPHNMLVTTDDRVKVADFGIARAISQATAQMQEEMVWGTPQYFSPEQAAGEPPTPASDVYALGVLLFESLTGRLPFTADSHTAMALKHLHTKPPLVSAYNPAVPPQLVQIVNKVLSKEPAGRYRTAGQMARILEMYRERSKEETAAFVATPRKQNGDETRLSAAAGGAEAVPITEQKTQIFTRREREAALGETAVAPPPEIAPQSDPIAIFLGLLALLLLLGLIPFWYYVYISLLP